ncbi:MAG: DUF2752 domain-containing protein [Clostridiales bacterium]|nr:DUF2752 domain-containing protein [Clostridiales bacterium]
MDLEIVMVNHWYNISSHIKQYKYRLLSLLEGIALFAALYIVTEIFKTSLCPIYHILGKRCFGCGMTRAFISILQLDFTAATRYHALSVPLFIGIGVYCLLLLIDILFDKQFVITMEKYLAKKYMYMVYFSILIISAVFNQCIFE